MSCDTQSSLFGDGKMTPPRRSGAPDAEAIRKRLTRLLDTLRAAEVEMPLSDRDLRMWRTVLPNMTKWLPEDEAQPIRTSFGKEVERLTSTSQTGSSVAAPGG